jgi:hypothetical protein
MRYIQLWAREDCHGEQFSGMLNLPAAKVRALIDFVVQILGAEAV